MGLRLKVAVFRGEGHVSGISQLCAAQGCIVPSCAHTHIQTTLGTYSIIKAIIHLIIFFRFFMYEHKDREINIQEYLEFVDYDRIGPSPMRKIIDTTAT